MFQGKQTKQNKKENALNQTSNFLYLKQSPAPTPSLTLVYLESSQLSFKTQLKYHFQKGFENHILFVSLTTPTGFRTNSLLAPS